MIKFLGLLSKKKKVKANLASAIYVNLLNNVIEVGFLEIKDFINNNNNLEEKPFITDQHSVRKFTFVGKKKGFNQASYFTRFYFRRNTQRSC